LLLYPTNHDRMKQLIGLFLPLAVLLGSCITEGETLSRSLEGTWTVARWTEDGVDILAEDDLDVFTLRFEDDGNRAGEGTFTWDLVSDGNPYALTGSYELSEDGTELELDFDTGGSIVDLYVEDPAGQRIDFELETLMGDELSFDGVVNGYLWIIDAERD
jgi:hypothetical protein